LSTGSEINWAVQINNFTYSTILQVGRSVYRLVGLSVSRACQRLVAAREEWNRLMAWVSGVGFLQWAVGRGKAPQPSGCLTVTTCGVAAAVVRRRHQDASGGTGTAGACSTGAVTDARARGSSRQPRRAVGRPDKAVVPDHGCGIASPR
jgi:hypothetical protein